MLVELIVAAFVASYVTVVAFGHVLLVAAIYSGPREDSSGGRAAAGPRSGRSSQRRRQ